MQERTFYPKVCASTATYSMCIDNEISAKSDELQYRGVIVDKQTAEATLKRLRRDVSLS